MVSFQVFRMSSGCILGLLPDYEVMLYVDTALFCFFTEHPLDDTEIENYECRKYGIMSLC